MTIHIRIDDEELNSKRKFACGIGPDLPEGDTYYFESERRADRLADCPGCRRIMGVRLMRGENIIRTTSFIHGCTFLKGRVSTQDSLTMVFGQGDSELELAIFGASNLDGLESLREALDALIAGQKARTSADAELGPLMAQAAAE